MKLAGDASSLARNPVTGAASTAGQLLQAAFGQQVGQNSEAGGLLGWCVQ